jgi:hypothetical protein
VPHDPLLQPHDPVLQPPEPALHPQALSPHAPVEQAPLEHAPELQPPRVLWCKQPVDPINRPANDPINSQRFIAESFRASRHSETSHLASAAIVNDFVSAVHLGDRIVVRNPSVDLVSIALFDRAATRMHTISATVPD